MPPRVRWACGPAGVKIGHAWLMVLKQSRNNWNLKHFASNITNLVPYLRIIILRITRFLLPGLLEKGKRSIIIWLLQHESRRFNYELDDRRPKMPTCSPCPVVVCRDILASSRCVAVRSSIIISFVQGGWGANSLISVQGLVDRVCRNLLWKGLAWATTHPRREADSFCRGRHYSLATTHLLENTAIARLSQGSQSLVWRTKP